MLKNSAQTWDSLWKGINDEEQTYRLAKERSSIRWKRIREVLRHEFGSIEGLRSVELGAGLATVSTLMAQEGADISIIDYSPRALDICGNILRKLNIEASLYEADGLNLPAELIAKFD